MMQSNGMISFSKKKSFLECSHFSDLSFNYLESRFSTANFRIPFSQKQLDCNLCFIGEQSQLWACLQCNFIGCPKHINDHYKTKRNKYNENPNENDLHSLMILLNNNSLNNNINNNGKKEEKQEICKLICFYCESEISSDIPSIPKKLYNHKVNPKTIYQLILGLPSYHLTSSLDTPEEEIQKIYEKKKENFEKLKNGICGLENLGNTCYMNAALQSLSNCEPLTEFFLTNAHGSSQWSKIRKLKIAHSYKNLIQQIWLNPESQKYVNPEKLLKDIIDVTDKFSGYHQQDSQEFIRCLITELNEGLTFKTTQIIKNEKESKNEEKIIERSPISDLFEGKYLSKVKCLKCEKESLTTEKFHDIQLSIPEVLDSKNENSGGFLSGISNWFGFTRRNVTLEDCLKLFCSPEQLLGEENYFCDYCKEKCNSEKQMLFLELPEILCFHIKRFKYDAYWSTKISDHVQLPLEDLKMRYYCSEEKNEKKDEMIYDLVSITNHSGALGGGHYIAYAKNFKNQKWYEFDDRRVTPVTTKEVLDAEAYFVLFQKRMSQNRKLEISKIKKLISENSLSEKVYISRQWWVFFKTKSNPGILNGNYEFFCPHKKLKTKFEFKEFKAIPKIAFIELQKAYEGYAIEKLEKCDTCLKIEQELDERREREKQFISKNDRTLIKNGECWYLIHCKWISNWLNFIKNGGDLPGPISNHVFFQDAQFKVLKPTLRKGVDYRVLVPEVWKFFNSNYGGGPEIKRGTSHPKVIYDSPYEEDEENESDNSQ